MRDLTRERFLSEVAKHQMTVLLDNGVHRHVRFAEPGTYCMSFGIVTWPGHLAYYGDMGTFVFSRLTDMFEFFRGHEPNLGYWAEKIEAAERHGGCEQFSASAFRAAVADRVRDFLSENPQADAKQLWHDVGVEVFSSADDGEVRAFDAAEGWEHSSGFQIYDFWESNCKEYTLRFRWCCYALPWAIAQYDASKAEGVTAVATATGEVAVSPVGHKDPKVLTAWVQMERDRALKEAAACRDISGPGLGNVHFDAAEKLGAIAELLAVSAELHPQVRRLINACETVSNATLENLSPTLRDAVVRLRTFLEAK